MTVEEQREMIGKIIWDNAQRMRDRMSEKLDEGVVGWNNPANLYVFKAQATLKVAEGDWLDAENYIMMILYLEQMQQLQGSSV